METPQDLIKPVAPAPSRSIADAGRKTDGTDFAEAMRVAQENSRPEARETETRDTQAPQRPPRDGSEDATDEPIYASNDTASKGAEPAATDGARRTGTEPSDPTMQAAAPGGGTDVVAAAMVTAAVQPVIIAANTVTPPVDADNTIDAAGAPRTAPLSTLSTAPGITGLQQPAGESDAAPLPSPLAPDLPSGPVASPIAGSAADQAIPFAELANGSAKAQQIDGSQVTNRIAPAGTEGRDTPPATTQAQIGLTPAPVALAVDRAIGNAIVNLPATGSFKAADLAAPVTADPARIASAGFVAAALQPTPADDAEPLLAQTPAQSSSLLPVLPSAADAAGADVAGTSGWLNVRPDSLAMALADRAMVQDAVSQLPAKLDQMLQSLDARLAEIANTPNPAGAPAAADGDPLGATVTAATDLQANPAIQIQPLAGGPADNAPEPVSLSLNAPMQQASRWASELGDRLAWVANNRLASATLQVNPPQLGPIEVRILMSGDQAAVSFAAVQPQTREAIQQALPVLASSLASQGLSLGQTSVGRDHLPQQGNQNGAGGNSASPSGLATDAIDAAGGVAAGTPTRGGNGLVDTFA